MKKLFLSLTIISAALLMTSCLGDVSRDYTDTTFVYLTTDDMGQGYGRTYSTYGGARLIMSNSMSDETSPIQWMSYNFDEENGTTAILLDGQSYEADNVTLREEPVSVETTDLMSPISDEEVEQPLNFAGMSSPVFFHDTFLGDYWIFKYDYKAKKGLVPKVTFHKREGTNSSGEVVIDIRLSLEGTSQDSEQVFSDYIAVNMSSLRSLYQSDSSDETSVLKIRFKYYLNDVETNLNSSSLEWYIGA